jgi:hypothetical protein
MKVIWDGNSCVELSDGYLRLMDERREKILASFSPQTRALVEAMAKELGSRDEKATTPKSDV